MSAETEVPSCVRGYHVYKDKWAAAVGEMFADAIVTEGIAILWDQVAWLEVVVMRHSGFPLGHCCRLDLDFTPLTS